MNTNTSVPKKFKEKDISWYIIDASKGSLGRIATKVSFLLLGKNSTDFVYNQVPRTKVIVVNAKKVRLTGNKLQSKKYYRHSGYAGGLKERTVSYYLNKSPKFIIETAVKGMLPKNKLRDKILKNLYIYEDTNHPHKANIVKVN